MSSTAFPRLANDLTRDTSSFAFPLAAFAGARQRPRMAAPSHAPIHFTVLAALLALLPACSRKSDVDVLPPPPRKLDVDVFIVTKSGESVKLGLVEVKAIPLDAAEKSLIPIITKQEIEYKKHEPARTKSNALTLARAAASEALRDFKQAANAAHASGAYGNFSGYLSMLNDVNPDSNQPQNLNIVSDILNTVKDREAVTQSGGKLKATVIQLNALLAERSRIEEELEQWKKSFEQSAEVLFAALPHSAISSKTNADGHCSLSLPSGSWVLAARASRLLPDGNYEQYIWIRKSPNGEHFMLSNDNILHPGESPFRD